MNWPTNNCDPYWEHADWLPPWYILDHWCQQDALCRQAKQQALLSACERGDINYRRSDGKTFDDPIHELSSRGILLIERDSFDAWAISLDGTSPLPARPRKQPPYPVWASPGDYRFDEEQWEWVSAYPPVNPPTTAPLPIRTVEQSPPRTVTPPAWGREMNAPKATTPSTAPEALALGADDDTDTADESAPALGDTKVDYTTYPSETELRELGVPTDEIIAAFQMEPTRHENEKWWKERMGNISRANKQLALALVQKGLPNRGSERYPSWWRPDQVAQWLIDARHSGSYKVAPILRKEFPKWAKLFDEQ